MRSALTVGAAFLALQLATPPPEIRGALITLASKTTASLAVTLENHRNSPLVECQIGITRKGSSAPVEFHGRYFSNQPSVSPDSIPVQPNARRALDLVLGNGADVDMAAITLAVFEDGFAEGTPAAVQTWRAARKDRRDNLAYWVRALEAMPRISEPDLRAYLEARRVDRVRDLANDPSRVRSRLESLLQQNPGGPEIWSALDRLRAAVRGELAALPPEPSLAGDATPSSTVPDVSISWERSATTEFVAAIENLRDVAIEAFGFELVNPVSGRPGSAHRTDFCMGEPEPMDRGHGRIQPHETREVLLGRNPGSQILRLQFVLFDDLVFEGSADARQQLLREREARADDLAFVIAVVSEAALLSADQARPFLAAKRAQRLANARSPQRGLDLNALDEYVRQLAESPERAAVGAKGYTGMLERQRQRLVRHLALTPGAPR